ncbi:MAG: hypothetical protein LH660_00770 [Phormidesmis sp. CAN_BIN36]|nr:hypothetical protein [Phormidesmis sp. CAN_BIN36]
MKKLLTIGLSVIWLLGSSIAASYAASTKPSASHVCPAEIKPLMALMLRDLPSYANRVIVRSRTRYSAISSLNSIITAGRPEFVPLPLAPGIASTIPSPQNSSDLRQVFITTLERQNTAGQTIELQQFHWLFLTKTKGGWRLALMFTRTGSVSAGQLITPPRESSQGTIGQAVQTWLRDCNAGAVRS